MLNSNLSNSKPRQIIKNLSGLIFAFCVATILFRTVEDACPYKTGTNFLMRRSHSRLSFFVPRVTPQYQRF